jgi:hypothetical protein
MVACLTMALIFGLSLKNQAASPDCSCTAADLLDS